HKKIRITPAYISAATREMYKAGKDAGLTFMRQIGLAPGTEPMTANKIIHSIHRVAGSITSFKSYCGGLVAPESDNNPWHYKFSWNPRNIVMAGKDGAMYKEDNKETYTAYPDLFVNNKTVHIPQLGSYAYYPNRDSLHYQSL